MEIELKPCPFCGGEAVLEEAQIKGKIFYKVRCKTNHCTEEYGWRSGLQKTIDTWNRRDEPPNPPLTLDELSGMVEEPVWIESPDMPNLHGWAINYGLDPDVMHIQYAEVSLDMYGKTWLAYRRKPEEE